MIEARGCGKKVAVKAAWTCSGSAIRTELGVGASGVVFERHGSRYYVLTAAHVVNSASSDGGADDNTLEPARSESR